MNNNAKQILGAVCCAAAVVLFWVFYALLIILVLPEKLTAVKIIIGAVFALFSGIMVHVAAERIKEIRSGEENDISKY